MKIYLISCVKQKKTGQHIANELYISPLFKKMLIHARNNGDKYYILSAKYGLLDAHMKISEYEESLNSKKEIEKKEWADNVFEDIKQNISTNDDIFILGGKNYYYYLEQHLLNNNYNVSIPMKGLSIGRMLQWLNNN